MLLNIDTKDQKMINVSLKEEGKVLKTLSAENKYGSQVLLPLIIKILPLQGWGILQGIEVEEGPGSFTGLKVGASVAQALGFALDISVNGRKNEPVLLKYI